MKTRMLVRCAAVLLMFGLNVTSAQSRSDSSPPGAAELPVTRLVLFTNGTGYFEHSGTVSGTQRVTLDVAADQMDDVLQSLVLADLDGGTIQAVRYPAEDPLERILASYSLDLSDNPGLAELLDRARGESVRVTGAEPLSGVIVGVESVTVPDEAPRSFLTLLSPTGLQRVDLAEVREFAFTEPALQAELTAALAAIARYRAEEEKELQLLFSGEGERRVQVGYVREMPLWKISYRLIPTAGEAELQGWAILDNPTSQDLNEVEVSFVAGQPLSFITELYDPVYVRRARVRPQGTPALAPPAAEPEFLQRPSMALADSMERAEPAPAPFVGMANAGVQAAASGSAAGAGFTYRVLEPVTVERYGSAMIPIVQQRVPATRLSLFDPAVLPNHPLQALRFVNDTGLHLAAGTVSIYADGIFSGNAQLADVLPEGTALLGYAVDLTVTVQQERNSPVRTETTVKLVNGLLEVSEKERLETLYSIDYRPEEGQLLAVQHARRSGFDLVATEPAPLRTASGYRFGVLLGSSAEDAADPATDLPVQLRCTAEEACLLAVTEERTVSETLLLENTSSEQLTFLLSNAKLSQADEALLDLIRNLKTELVSVERQLKALEGQYAQVNREQERIRQNMGSLDRTSTLYQRYVSELSSQEDALSEFASEQSSLLQQKTELQTELDAVIRGLLEQQGS